MTQAASLRTLRRTQRALAVMFALILTVPAACSSASSSGDPSSSATPTGSSATPSLPGSIPPAPTTPPPSSASGPASPVVADGLGRDTVGVVVATDGLRVRSLPTVGSDSEPLEPLLPEGARFYVV